MKLQKFILIIFLTLISLAPCLLWAQIPSIELQVDRSQMALNDLLTMQIIIKGGSALTRPEIPSQGNFQVVAQASGNNIEIINGQMSVTHNFTYQLSPIKEGTFEIGPITAHIDGRTYSAGPARVVVSASKLKAAPYLVPNPGFPAPGQPMPYPPSPQGPPSSSGLSGTPLDTPQETTFLRSEVNKQEAYVGEQILYTFRLYSAVNLQGANLKLPEFKDFIAEELIQQRQYEVDLGGRRYGVNEWRLALIPTKAGKLKTGTASIQARVAVPMQADPFQDPFFRVPRRVGYEDKTFQAPSQTIQVKALPPTFMIFTGLVGKFKIKGEWDKTEIKVGESAHWKVTLTGEGNLQTGDLPDWPQNPLLKVYPSSPSLDIKKSDQGLSGSKTFQAAYVGQRPGLASLNSIVLSYFNPETESYEGLEVEGQQIKITGDGQTEAWVKAGGEKDFLLLQKTNPNGFWATPRSLKQVLATPSWTQRLEPVFYILLLSMPLAYSLLVVLKKIQKLRATPSEDRKRSLAFKRAKAELASLSSASREQLLDSLPRILREYLHNAYHLPEGAFTSKEVEKFLQEHGVSVEKSRPLVYLIDQLEQFRYSPNLASLPLKAKSLQNEVLEILKQMEKTT